MAVFEEVRDVVVEQLNVSPEAVKLESKIIEDLGADSLDVVELVMALEEKFDIQIPDTEAEKLISIQNVVDYIEKIK
jgi:acyl carrier protein